MFSSAAAGKRWLCHISVALGLKIRQTEAVHNDHPTALRAFSYYPSLRPGAFGQDLAARGSEIGGLDGFGMNCEPFRTCPNAFPAIHGRVAVHTTLPSPPSQRKVPL